ncbi:MAG: methyltransferase domain-containing protein [bacterium]
MIKIVAAIIKRNSDGFIYVIPKKGSTNPKVQWKFPVGNVKGGETPKKCLGRVLREQFGLSTEIGELLTEKRKNYNYKTIQIIVFWVTNLEENLNDQGGDWLPPEKLLAEEWDTIDDAIGQALQDHFISTTKNYYENSSNKYFKETVNNLMDSTLEKFIQFLPENGRILDLGCGSGRDSKYFMNRGFQVVALDYSANIAELASKHIGQDVINKKMEDINYQNEFDGIWACASLLHFTPRQLEVVLNKIINALQPGGILFTSFKEGKSISLDEKGRYFNNHTVNSLTNLLKSIPNNEIIEIWQEESILRGKKQSWVSTLIQKVEKE